MARLAIAAPLVLFAAGPAFAESVFTVENVAIDAEAASAADARARALADGQRAALEILLRRLTVTGAREAPPMPDGEALAAMVEGFSIAGERVSPTRYRAALTVDFDPRAVRRLLRDNRIAYAETVGKPVLLVAVLRRPLGARLWGEGNPWRRVWEERPPPRGLVPIVLPLGDVVDLGLVDAARALAPDREALAALARRHGAAEVAVALVGPLVRGVAQDDPMATAFSTTLSLRRFAVGGDSVHEEAVTGRAGEDERAFLDRAAARVAALLERDWKRANLIVYDSARALPVLVPLENLGAWVAIRRQLAGLAVIAAVDIDSLSRRAARLTLRHYGTIAQLRLALDQAALALEAEEGGWVLRLRPPPAARADGGRRG